MHSVKRFNIYMVCIHLFQCLLDNMVSTGCSQVMIPFDASSDPKDIAQHVMTTISKVVAKVTLPFHTYI